MYSIDGSPLSKVGRFAFRFVSIFALDFALMQHETKCYIFYHLYNPKGNIYYKYLTIQSIKLIVDYGTRMQQWKLLFLHRKVLTYTCIICVIFHKTNIHNTDSQVSIVLECKCILFVIGISICT